jgi:threonine/homoserine/homoserine lactone efflux protein
MEFLPLLGPVAWYVFVMAGTPGPNNTMLAASGMNFGLARTLPHLAGICAGITLLMLATGLGLGVIFATLPEAQTALAVAGSLYLIYLAWRIANAAAPAAAENAKPIVFWEAFGFQFLNPKGWVMALNAALLMPEFDHVITKAIVLAILALTVGFMPMAVWTLFGMAIARIFQNPRWRRIINWSLAAILLATIPFMFT